MPRKKLLVVPDIPNWAFDKIYKNLKKLLTNWDVYVHYTSGKNPQDNLATHKKFDLIFYLSDYDLRPLIKANIPKHKVILGIRSKVKDDIYNSPKRLQRLVGGLSVPNQQLYERFKDSHPIVELTPGGVDTKLFCPISTASPERKITVGWAGSKNNMHVKGFRGLELITAACKRVGYLFKPALKEVKHRNEREMASYYQNDIDIYVDASISAGRQNGLVEAGACGKPLISTRVGIAEQLIKDRINGVLVDRNINSIAQGLVNITPYINLFGERIREEIEENWSWEKHVPKFENLFSEVLAQQ